MDKLVGKTLEGLYRLDELIGVGGMANVYRARDLKHDRTVAVKVLREEYADNVELVRRFKNESKAISVLNHPNIVKVYDVSVTDALQYIVMEYIDGITLKEYLRQRAEPLTWKETVHFTTQVLKALAHAHANGVVHRDVKPQNIMLLADGSIRMMDFGIARFARSECQTTGEKKAIGSVHYISPEQAKGDVTDAKADIYSVGVMMYEMLTGKLPFEADDAVAVAMKQISDTAVPVRRINPAVPEALEEITARAMAKDPAARYPSADDMLADLEEFKKNPSIRFEYQYITDNSPTRYINTIVKQTKNTAAAAQKPAARRAPAASGSAAKKRKKRRRHSIVVPVMLGMALAFALGSAFLCYQIFTNSNNMLFSDKPDVTLVNFVGMTRGQVEADRSFRDNFKLVFEEEYNPHYEPGTVYEQTPRPPKEVKQGQKVVLKVSKGVKTVEVPDVSTLTRESAQQKLREQGLTVTIRPDRTTAAAVNTVVRTDPAAGTAVAEGDTIVLFVAQPKIDTERIVPDIRNFTLGDVKTKLAEAQLAVGNMTEEYSDDVPAGVVISQSIEPGTKVRVRSRISFVMSMGPAPATLSISYDPETFVVGKTTVFTAVVTGAKPEDVQWVVGDKTYTGAQFSVTWEKEGTYELHAQIRDTPADVTIKVKKPPEPTPTPTPTPTPDPEPTPEPPTEPSEGAGEE